MKIAELTPEPLKRTFFACSGSESVEAALRLAKKYTGRHEIVALVNGYHGQTAGSASITAGARSLRDGYGASVSDVSFIPTPTRTAATSAWTGGVHEDLRRVRRGVHRLHHLRRARALFYEPMLSTAGQVVPSVEWTQEMRRICDERGMLMWPTRPSPGSGAPASGSASSTSASCPTSSPAPRDSGEASPCARDHQRRDRRRRPRQGVPAVLLALGDPLLCAVGLKNLEIVERENLVENARVVGAYMEAKLKRMEEQYEIVGEGPRPGAVPRPRDGDRQGEPDPERRRRGRGHPLLLRPEAVGSPRASPRRTTRSARWGAASARTSSASCRRSR